MRLSLALSTVHSAMRVCKSLIVVLIQKQAPFLHLGLLSFSVCEHSLKTHKVLKYVLIPDLGQADSPHRNLNSPSATKALAIVSVSVTCICCLHTLLVRLSFSVSNAGTQGRASEMAAEKLWGTDAS